MKASSKLEEKIVHVEGYCKGTLPKRKFVKHYLMYLSTLLVQLDIDSIEKIIDTFSRAREQGGTLYFLGNGGSASITSHFVNDLGVGLNGPGMRPFKAISLADNLAVITALANDEGYAKVFVRQLEGVLRPEDVVVALSVSGNSANILEAVKYAKAIGAPIVGCTGFDGGKLRQIADVSLHIPTERGEYGPVEDIFMILAHVISSSLRIEQRGHL